MFRQVSNYSIVGVMLVDPNTFTKGVVTYGLESVRVWRVDGEKGLIRGTSVYMGQAVRKVKYTAGVGVGGGVVLVADSEGFVTAVSGREGKMLRSMRVTEGGIDAMVRLGAGRVMVGTAAGGIKVVSGEDLSVIEEFNLQSRVLHIK